MNETVIFFALFFEGWGHLLTDIIRRVWFFNSDEYKNNYQDCKIVYLPAIHNGVCNELSGNYLQFLKIVGIPVDKLVPIDKVTRCRRIIIPDECLFRDNKGNRLFTVEYKNLIDKVRNYQKHNFHKDKSYDKVYYTHLKYNRDRQDIGEEKLEQFFADLGYKVIAPENYTWDEQLNILANCHSFASTLGSCAHNMIFLPEHSNVFLINRTYYCNGYQVMLNKLYEQNIHYIDSALSILSKTIAPWSGPFYYFISKNLLQAFNLPVPGDKEFWQQNLADLDKYLSRVDNWYELRDFTPPLYYMWEFWKYAGFRRSLKYLPIMFGWKVFNKIKRFLSR